ARRPHGTSSSARARDGPGTRPRTPAGRAVGGPRPSCLPAPAARSIPPRARCACRGSVRRGRSRPSRSRCRPDPADTRGSCRRRRRRGRRRVCPTASAPRTRSTGPGSAPRGQARAGVAARAARAPPRSSRRSCPPGRAPRDSIEYAGPFTGHHVRIRHHPVPARTQERAPAPRVRAAARPGHLVGPPPEPREPEAPSRIAGAPAGLRLLPEPGRRVNRAERADAADEAIDPQAAEAPPVPMPGEQLELKVFARLYGEPVVQLPQDLYIPPDALEIFLDSFEGPLDLLLYLIRKQNFNVLDIPMAEVTRQYLAYIEEIRRTNLELAAEYLLMAALLI